ncbi:MAG: hypothetical protein KBB39_09760 [Phycicoccus sp.]|nr:hypothetical protein [Phycicoccus sp.]
MNQEMITAWARGPAGPWGYVAPHDDVTIRSLPDRTMAAFSLGRPVP